MKQKRKVKALSSSNGCRTFNGNDLITSLLLVLGGVLLLGSISLFTTHGVDAAKLNSQIYTGVTNKTETIYRVTFVSGDNKDEISNMYVDKGSNGSDFYITSNSVVAGEVSAGNILTTSDTVGKDTSSSVLGGKAGKITGLKSANITLVGGNESNISRGNDNAALLGGSEIEIGEGSSGVPLAVIGGSNNKIEGDQNGDSLIGGSNNNIGSNNTNVHVLGGKNNVVSGNNSNVIVAGEGVRVDSDVNDIFAFSADASQFFPKSSNAFYLDVSGGLGLDKDTEDGKVSSNGAVSMGELSSDDLDKCKYDLDGFVSENVGVQGTIQGCVVGCTSRSISDLGWELLDKSEYCVDVCESTYNCNIYPDTDGTKGGEDHEYAYCTGIDVKDSWWNGRVSQCGGDGAETKYEDVVFKTKIIDVDGTCPGDMTPKGENQCTFKCNAGYHLVDGKCYKDCTRDGRTIKHNESDYWNPSTTETCPIECDDTKALLTCNDGTLYNGSSVDTTHTVYQSNCTTQPLPSPADYNRSSAVSNAECSSFQPYEVNNNACKALPKTYKCTNCNEHYTLNSSNLDILPNGDTSAQCLQDCPFIAGPSRNTIYLSGWTGSPNSSIVAYDSGSYICPAMGTSYSQVRQCNDGSLDGTITYKYVSYDQVGVKCEDNNSGLTRTLSSQISNATLVSPSYCVEYQADTCDNLGTKYYYQCDDTYGWNSAGTKCVKCTGNPSNAVRNNYSMPDDTMELYFDDVNTSDPCTFSCAEGAYYDASLGVCVGYTCDGVAHGETRTLTRDKTPACPTECDEITATCYSGIWYNNGTAVTDYSLGTCTTSSKTCSINDSGNIKWFNSSVGSKTPAALVDTCTEYSSSGKGCTAGSTYKSWLCDGINYWNGDNCEPVCVNNACADGFTAYGIAGNTSYVCRKGGVSNTVTCNCGAGKKWSSSVGACVDGVDDATCSKELNKCTIGTPENKKESNTAYTWDCVNEFGETTSCTIYKCTGTAPSTSTHTVANNGDYPSSSTAWHYSTDTSEACSYICDDGFYRVPSCSNSSDDECRAIDHYERRFFRNGEEITEYVNTFYDGWDQKFGVFISTTKLSNEIKKSGNWHHNNCWNTSGVGLNELSSFRGSFYKPSSTEGKITTDLTKFYTDGIPIVSSLPQGYVSYDRQGFSCEELNYVFNGSSQPSVSKYKADNYKGQTINLYIGSIHGGVSEGCNGDCGWDVWPITKNDRYANLFFYSDAYASDYYIVQAVSVPMFCPATTTSSPSSGGGGGGGGGCFLAGTQVYMADGTTKNIEDVESGDMVMTYNTAAGKVEAHRVLRPLVHENNNDELYELTINGEILKVTEVHNFYITRDGFEESGENQCTSPYRRTMAKELQVGDKILMNDGTLAEIENITHRSNYGTVYNLSIEYVHTYFVDKGYLVHNELNKADLDLSDGSNDNSDCGGPGNPECRTIML